MKLSDTGTAELWVEVARARKKHGDLEGAKQARRNADVYRGRSTVNTLYPHGRYRRRF